MAAATIWPAAKVRSAAPVADMPPSRPDHGDHRIVIVRFQPAFDHQVEAARGNPDQITTPKLAVNREVEQRSVSKSLLLIQHEADLPNFLGFMCPFEASRACAPQRHRRPKGISICASRWLISIVD